MYGGTRSMRRAGWLAVPLVVLVSAGCGGGNGTGGAPGVTGLVAGVPIAVGDAPSGLVAVPGGVAVVNEYSRSVVLVGAGGEVTTLCDECSGPLLFAFGSLWASGPVVGEVTFGLPEDPSGAVSYPVGSIVRLDPATGEQQALVEAEGTLMVATDDAVWGLGGGGALNRIDPATNTVTVFPGVVVTREEGEPVELDALVWPRDLAWDGTRFWLLAVTEDQSSSAVIGLEDPADPSGAVSVDLGAIYPTGLAVGNGVLWVTAARGGLNEGVLLRVGSRASREVWTVPFGRLLSGVAVGDDGLWVTDCLAGTLTLVDPDTTRVIAGPVSVGTVYPEGEPFDMYREDFSCPGAVLPLGDTVWVANWNDDAVVPVTLKR